MSALRAMRSSPDLTSHLGTSWSFCWLIVNVAVGGGEDKGGIGSLDVQGPYTTFTAAHGPSSLRRETIVHLAACLSECLRAHTHTRHNHHVGRPILTATCSS